MTRLVLAATVAACAGIVAFASPAPAVTTATCTYAQKQARTAALKAFLAKTRGRKLTSAQKQRLRALRAAAACSVPPLLPSSGASCDFELAPSAEGVRNRPFATWPWHSVGPVDREVAIPTHGRVEAVLIFVDFPNAPADGDPSGRAARYTSDLVPWLRESSYGRLSLGVTVVPRWFRMPKAGRDYGFTQEGTNADRYLADVAAAVGAAVDLARYQLVFVAPSDNASPFLGVHYTRYPGRGVAVPGGEVRFGMLMGAVPGASEPAHAIHRFLALLGGVLVDTSPTPFGHWDPGWAVAGRFATVHPVAWHKWMFRWIDPEQITCVRDGEALEETLTPLARAGGKKMVVVPTGASTAYVLEVRRRLGYDRAICREGVLVYTVDSQLLPDQGAIAGKSAGAGCSPDVTPFGVGESYEDAVVRVDVLATDGSGYRVRVTKK